MNKKTLVISPHIDDEVLGCFSALGSDTHVMECGADEFHVVDRKERLTELNALADHVGFSYEVRANEVNNYKIQDLIRHIESVINTIEPEEVFIPYPSYNQDHVTVYNAALVALRHHDTNHFVKRVFAYEEVHSMLWDNTHDINSSFKGNYFVSCDVDEKIEAYKILKSQVRAHRSPKMLKVIARFRGEQANKKYAESFQILRWVK